MKINKRNNHTTYVSDMSKAPVACIVVMFLLADILTAFGHSLLACFILCICSLASLITKIYCVKKHSAILSIQFNLISLQLILGALIFILLPVFPDNSYFSFRILTTYPLYLVLDANIDSAIENDRKKINELRDSVEKAEDHVKELESYFPINVTDSDNFEFGSPEYEACFLFACCRETLLNMSEKDFLSWFIHNQREITIPGICSYKGKDTPAIVSYLAFLRNRELRK